MFAAAAAATTVEELTRDGQWETRRNAMGEDHTLFKYAEWQDRQDKQGPGQQTCSDILFLLFWLFLNTFDKVLRIHTGHRCYLGTVVIRRAGCGMFVGPPHALTEHRGPERQIERGPIRYFGSCPLA